MVKKGVQSTILLPARMDLAEEALRDLEIVLLEFPFTEMVANFSNKMEEVLSHNRKKKVWVPYRQLNNGLLACTPTLIYGFESSGKGNYRALAVGTIENPLRVPTPEQIHELVKTWAQEWTKQFYGKGKADQVNSVCDRFLEDIAIIPDNWNWQPISIKKLIQDINAEKGLGFQAIPSFLATLLHGKKCVICSGEREQEIQWRKVQGDGSSRTGLFLVSQPFRVLYTDDNDKYQIKLDAWRDFLKQKVIASIDSTIKPYCFAIIEIGQSKKKGVHPKQSIYRIVREACVLEKISSQMVQTVKPKSADKEDESIDISPSYNKKTEGRILNAVLDVTLRQIGALYGIPSEVYKQAGIPKEIAQNLDVIALCRPKATQGQDNIHYDLAVRLRANGAVDVLFPNRQDWIPYAQAGIELGQIFSQVRRDRSHLKIVQLKGIDLAKFAADVLTMQVREQPTLVLIEADVWRNERGEENEGQAWFQLKNEYLLAKRDVLDFEHVPGHACVYPRDHNNLNNLLGVIRFRTGDETTQYIINRQTWDENSPARDLIRLSGFYDTSIPELLHYFSIGKLPTTQKTQDSSIARELYMLDSQNDEYGANIAFKHQQMLEMVPFFIHPDFQKTEESLKVLCRVPHYLRISPAWSMGNILSPYPMHLGKQLIKDHLCILGVEI